MTKNVESLLRLVIYEELGRNLHTISPDQMTWHDSPWSDVKIDHIGMAHVVTIKDIKTGESKIRSFSNESDAEWYARRESMRIDRSRLSSGEHDSQSDND